MKMYKTDLHIHTCLSPCAELEMSPRNIVRMAKKCGLDIIGICDHNSCENVPYIIKSAEKEELKVTGGIEITTREEVHILALFDDVDDLFAMQEIIYDHLRGTNVEQLYGDQVIVNDKDEVMGFNKRLLIGATELSIEDLLNNIHELNGIAIASHIDRDSFSLISQLGFVPAGLPLDAFEISTKEKINSFKDAYSPVVSFSDAHRLEQIGKNYTHFIMEQANVKEMSKAFLGENNRTVMF